MRVATSPSRASLARAWALRISCSGQIDGVAQVEIVAAPGRDVRVEQLLDGLGDPGGRVDAVGDGVDGELGEHLAGDLAVLHGHAVDVAGEAQRE